MNPFPIRSAINYRPVLYRVFFSLYFSVIHFSLVAQEPAITSDNEIAKVEPAKNANKIIYGLSSYYAQKFQGRLTANGEIFSHQKFTAACNVLPLGTWIQVTNLKNGKVIVVRTNDRLHPKTRRIIDLTYVGANKLGFIKNGLTRVKIEILNQKLYKKLTKN